MKTQRTNLTNACIPTRIEPFRCGRAQSPAPTPKEQQWKLRYHRVGVALDALTADIDEQTVFKVRI